MAKKTDERPHKAHGVDAELQAKALLRLKRIEGQVRGLQRMVEEGRYCADILEQISSVQESLVGVGKVLMKNHLRHCVSRAVQSGEAAQTERVYDELVEILGRHWR